MTDGLRPLLTPRRVRIGVCTFLVLYLELVLIRWLGGEIKLFSYFKNFVLMAVFLGFGIGCLRPTGPEVSLRRFPYGLLLLVLVCTLSQRLGLARLFFPDADIVQWNGSLVSPAVRAIADRTATWLGLVSPALVIAGLTAAILVIVYAILAVVAVCFFELGGVLADAFRGERPLVAYSADIIGSLIGSGAAVLGSYAGTPPVVWLAIVTGAALWLIPASRRRVPAILFAAGLVVSGAHTFTHRENYYSPYYLVSTHESDVVPAEGATPAVHSWAIHVNHSSFQVIYDFSARAVERYRRRLPAKALGEIEGVRARHELPFRLAGSLDRVAIVGAGTGNDVAAGLRFGARDIVAVDIDPTILRLGVDLHPEQPYASPAVRVVNDDARAFFEQGRNQPPYDLVVFGTLDSHAALNALTSLRLEYFVYTRESFQRARSLVKPDGLLVVAFGTSWKAWVTDRMVRTMRAVFGSSLRVLELSNDQGRMFFVGGAAVTSPEFDAKVREIGAIDTTARFGVRDVPISTDDWPYLYMDPERRPWVLILCVLLNIAIAGAALKRLSVPGDSRPHRLDAGQMFFMGAGFLLIETKAVTEVSLVFGATWVVNAIVFMSLLVAILLANLYVWRRPGVDSRTVLVLLIAALGIRYVLADAQTALYGLPQGRWFAPAIACGPAVLASIAFARMFSASSQGAYALGWNVVGAMCGGALELVAIATGNRALNLIAIVLYGAALTCHVLYLLARSPDPVGDGVVA